MTSKDTAIRPRRRAARARGPTLADVARAAEVSTATVSRYLNAPDLLTEETRARVAAAVEALGYTPHFGGRALASQRTDTFAAIVPTLENAIFAQGLQAFQEVLEARGITLLVASSSYSRQAEARQVRALAARGAEALLLVGQERDPETYAFLRARRLPFVLAWTAASEQSLPSVGFDNRAAMARLAGEVFARGHRRCAMIAGIRSGNDRAQARVMGVLDAAREAGLAPEAIAIIEAPYTIEAGAAALSQAMEARPRPTAVLCGNDVLAAGALSRAREMGLRVPEDISITGFDDLELARLLSPPLATVAVPHRAMGEQAAQLLLDLREGAPGRNVLLEARPVLRGSLGPPP